MKQFPRKLHKKLSERATNNSLRKLTIQNNLIDFSSNDYLGFSQSENVFKKAHELVKELQSKNGATGSRLLSGNHELHEEVEQELATFFNVESALLFNSGYDANIGLFSSVPQRGDIIFYDELIHASIRDGIKMGNATAYKFKHNDIKDLLKRHSELVSESHQNEVAERSRSEVYIVTESVFSMDGDSPDLVALADFCSKNNCHLIVDEAHATGVFEEYGQGLVQLLKLEDKVFARIHTFGKALGCHGAVVLGSSALQTYLINFARSFIYTTAIPLHNVATIKCSFDELLQTKEIEKLKNNIKFFNQQLATNNQQLNFIESNSAIHCCIISGNEKVKLIAKQLQEKGFDVKPILSPTVTKEQERLRFCLHNYNSEEEIKEVLELLSTFVVALP